MQGLRAGPVFAFTLFCFFYMYIHIILGKGKGWWAVLIGSFKKKEEKLHNLPLDCLASLIPVSSTSPFICQCHLYI